jgi:2',3'-cyclic-nucleotide 2'-phosphodiesterase (5'-nucleotidase family)
MCVFLSSDQQSQTVLEVQVYDNTKQAYVPLDLLKVYTIGTYSFLRAGGSDYSTFAQTALDAFDFGPTDNVVATQFLSRFTVNSQLNVRSDLNSSMCSYLS